MRTLVFSMLILCSCGGDVFRAGPAQELVALEGGADTGDPSTDATAGQEDGPEDPAIDARTLPPESGSRDGGGVEDAPMAVDALSSADVVQPQDAPGDEPEASADADADAPQDASEDTGPSCTCATGCCPVSGGGYTCAPMHTDGVGQSFDSCVAVGTYSEPLAADACAAYAAATGATCETSSSSICGGADLAVCTTTTTCWVFQGPDVGQVRDAGCGIVGPWN